MSNNYNLDVQVIPYSDESTLCVVCKQRIELEQVNDDFVFRDAKNVCVEGKSCISHIQCY